MPNKSDNDWRLNGQEKFLQEAELKRTEYSPPSPEWDHDHCEFCWAKFMDAGASNALGVGYKTLNDSHWICETCFDEFKTRFKWILKP